MQKLKFQDGKQDKTVENVSKEARTRFWVPWILELFSL